MTPAQELAQLIEARTKLLSGKAQTEIRYGERTVKYAVSDLEALNARISQLEAATSDAGGRRPFEIVW